MEEFLFAAPLYVDYKIDIGQNRDLLESFFGGGGKRRFDGHCPYCKRATTFDFRPAHVPGGDPWNNLHRRFNHEKVELSCVRDDSHEIEVYFRLKSCVIQKIGQYPSMATIANDEILPYRKFMNDVDGAELHKAVGLAAHGVGVGSMAYLRRVFERMIHSRFQEFGEENAWDGEEFERLRMDEKTAQLKGHLPRFLVDNAKIYSILSVGIHELSEETCLSIFDVLKQSILAIVDEDRKAREDKARLAELGKALNKIHPKVS